MLRLVLRGIDTPSNPVVRDVEWEFFLTKLVKTDTKEALLQEVEQATWGDESRFVDRFGFGLHWTELSTGCKAGFVVDSHPDKCIDLIECGNNAIESIIVNCRSGEVLTSAPDWRLRDTGECDVECHGRHFTNMKELSEYLEWGGYIDL